MWYCVAISSEFRHSLVEGRSKLTSSTTKFLKLTGFIEFLQKIVSTVIFSGKFLERGDLSSDLSKPSESPRDVAFVRCHLGKVGFSVI